MTTPSAAPTSIPRLSLGELLFTPGAIELLVTHRVAVVALLRRHAAGDWGDLDAEDRALNRQAIVQGGRVLSSYHVAPDARVWIITEADRSATTVLLPEEY